MKMVRKIAITASTLLFVLAQFLSGYLIHQNYEEKIILMEEKEKGPYTSSFARYYNAEITIYKPKDYGTKAQQNINAITTLFDSFELKYEIINGKKDSTKIEFEDRKSVV